MNTLLLSMDLSNIQFSDITGFLVVGFIIWQVVKNIMDVVGATEKTLTRKQGWDNAARIIKEKEKTWDEGLANVYNERQRIVDRYDSRLDDQDARMSEEEAKTQQLLAMMCMCLQAQDAILEALVSNGIGNGEIKDMHKKLKAFIMDQVQV